VTAPKAAIISTGSELLQGVYADTNARDISRLLTRAGFGVEAHFTCPDHAESIARCLCRVLSEVDLVVMTGGLGPTFDDATRGAVAQASAVPLRMDRVAARMLRHRFGQMQLRLPEHNLAQALVPEGAVPLRNHWGTAPGFVLPPTGGRRAVVVALPGPPHEWRPMLARALPRCLLPLFPRRPARQTWILHFAMLPESEADSALRALPPRPGLETTLLSDKGHLRVCITATARSEQECQGLLRCARTRVLAGLGEADLFCEGDLDMGLAEGLVQLLSARRASLAVVDVCTAGHVVAEIGAAGIRTVLRGARVSPPLGELASAPGARGATRAEQSAEVPARTLAEQCRAETGADYGLSLVRSPHVGSPDAEGHLSSIGVWFGLASARRTTSLHRVFHCGLEAMRSYAAHQAYEMVRGALLAELGPQPRSSGPQGEAE
jgi:nicotinamide-nucleotide amidase